MLQKENRLKSFSDFAILFKEGRFCFGNFIDLKNWKINKEKYPQKDFKQDDLKIAFVVSKKNIKSAVKRNKIKRQMREAVRLLIKEKKIRLGYFLFFVAKKEITNKNFDEIKKEIIFLLEKINILIKYEKDN